jgi:hypothetical protein
MTAEQAKNAESSSNNEAPDVGKKQISTIQFPYGDLDDAVEFAKAIHAVGGQSCTTDQVAAYLKQSITSGAFRLRTSYPRIFGLTETERGGMRLTPLGLRIVDPMQEAVARVEAFLHVPLYKAIFDKYKGYTLPPNVALEREMANLGVSPKQTDKARQAFERSARQAGFMWAGPDRLVMPALKDRGETGGKAPESKPLENGTPGADQRSERKGGGGGGDPPDRNELMRMLLRFLPDGSLDNEQLARWLKAAEVNLRMAYNTPGSINIEAEAGD